MASAAVVPSYDIVTEQAVVDAISTLKSEMTAEQARKAVVQAASTATDTTGIVADFNALLTKLKNAGLMATS